MPLNPNADKELRASQKYSFIKINQHGICEIYADHHMLSSLRKCEAYFVEHIINRLAPKAQRYWSLEFGSWFHECMEIFNHLEKEFNGMWPDERHAFYIGKCCELWNLEDLNFFSETKQFKSLGGLIGAIQLLEEYYYVYAGKDRVRIIGTELGFGKNREVPLNRVQGLSANIRTNKFFPFHAYLTGRIDLLIDRGEMQISPEDYKTTAYFDGTEAQDFKPQEALTGYAFAVHSMLQSGLIPIPEGCNNTCYSATIKHISLKQAKIPEERFKRSVKYYSPEEYDEFVERNLRTFNRLYELVVLNDVPQWNTEWCVGKYGSDCAYKQLHELAPSSREAVKNSFYQITEPWSPYKEK